ncbi:MAG: lamin tail domain-containing protein [Prolixibacteraceae bacterium]|nr:lamin tail domain-containing protein [Prolixibacteraceae bacterium]
MPRLIVLAPLFFTLILSKTPKAQIVYSESFIETNKGYWADSTGNLCSDFSNVSWKVDIGNAFLEDANDYAKTVSTSGGRFEVLDTDSEIIWSSPLINISEFELVNISLQASETGSSTVSEKKYMAAFYQLNQNIIPFSPVANVSGNWGEQSLRQTNIKGDSLRIIVKMNSEYANDKIILDDVVVEGINPALLLPSNIHITNAPAYSFTDSVFTLEAVVRNGYNEKMNEPQTLLNVKINNKTHVATPDSSGVFRWEISLGTPGEYAMQFTSTDYSLPAAENTITVYAPETLVDYIDFEESLLPATFENTNNWAISTDSPIEGFQSLKHIEFSTTDADSAIYQLNKPIGANGDELLISFTLKNGDWNPSASNSFFILLEPADKTRQTTLAIGINAKGASDRVSVWTYRNGTADLLLAETDFTWTEAQTASISLSRKEGQNWFLNVLSSQSGKQAEASFNFQNLTEILKLKLVYNFTSTRAGLLWFDKLLILSKNVPPSLVSATGINPGEYDITFSETIDTSKLQTSNFQIESLSGRQYQINSLAPMAANRIRIKTEAIENESHLKLSAYNICDQESLCSAVSSITFLNVFEAEYGDVAINEIMADPSPPQALPDAEYIELYNRSQKNILLHNWQLNIRNNTRSIGDSIVMKPGQYLILCKTDYIEAFSLYGETCGIDRFPSLLNSGANIRLSDSNQQPIDEITYSDEWYQSSDKKEGGYSLERMDANRFCGQTNNWLASDSEAGGTPGIDNSVARDNTDTKAPEIISCELLQTNRIKITFNERIDTAFFSKSNIDFAPFEINHIELSKTGFELEIAPALTNKREYELSIFDLADECGNTAQPLHCRIFINLAQAGEILINELLFNPISDGADFIEIYNHSEFPVNLASLYLTTRDGHYALSSLKRFAANSDTLHPASYGLITTDIANIQNTYPVQSSTYFIEAESLPAMHNTEGRIVLLNDSLDVIDEVYYHESMHSEWLTDYDGVSLERVSFTIPTNEKDNWKSASSLAAYATPGAKNSQAETEEGQSEIDIELSSNALSPNGDNYNDELEISISGNTTDYLISLFVYDVQGIEKKRILNNELGGTSNTIGYNLHDNHDLLLRPGTYILFAEMIHPDKKTVVKKKAFHVSP